MVELLAPAIRLRGSPAWTVLEPLLAGHPWLRTMQTFLAPAAEPILSPAVADALYGPVLRTSVSALEHFAACPFRFFVRSGLRATERRQFEVDAREQGSFQHEILARFHGEIRAEGRQWRQIAPAEARQRIRRIAGEVTRGFREGLFAASSEREAEARRLTTVLEEFIEIAVEWMAHCAFDPVMVEVGFGRTDDGLPAWELELDPAHRLAFRGKIDRVDLAPGDDVDEALCMVVDYKSSARAVDPLLLEHGIQIQLPAYLLCLREFKDARAVFGVRRLRPVGMFYVSLRGTIESGGNRREVFANADDRPAEGLPAYRPVRPGVSASIRYPAECDERRTVQLSADDQGRHSWELQGADGKRRVRQVAGRRGRSHSGYGKPDLRRVRSGWIRIGVERRLPVTTATREGFAV